MRNTFIILSIIFIGYGNARAQEEPVKDKGGFTITTSVFETAPAMVGLPISIFNLGTDISLNKNYSIALNVGYIYGKGTSLLNFTTENNNGFRVQGEIRRYFNKTKMWEPGVLLFPPHIFQYKTVNKWNAGYYTGWLTDYQYTESEVDIGSLYTTYRHAAKLHALIGYQCFKSYHVVVDFSVGAGIQYIFSESPKKIEGFSESGPWGENFHEESGIFPSIGYKLRVGFWL
ncbi:MAG: hypothetical protein C0599_11660 [Salinivirgaceae bacterium]|nr:MAG: hypothetical protein C0599_11660 [Salinivirgaceae bacterium]